MDSTKCDEMSEKRRPKLGTPFADKWSISTLNKMLQTENAILEAEKAEQEMMDDEEDCGDDCRDEKVRGVLVFYVNVGQLLPFKAEAFVGRMEESMDLTRVKKDCEVFFIPTRTGDTRVEYISFGR